MHPFKKTYPAFILGSVSDFTIIFGAQPLAMPPFSALVPVLPKLSASPRVVPFAADPTASEPMEARGELRALREPRKVGKRRRKYLMHLEEAMGADWKMNLYESNYMNLIFPLGTIISIDFHIFQRGCNHQSDGMFCVVGQL